MPSKSKSQQRFMGMVHAIQKGELSPDDVSDKVKDVADNMSDKDAEDFASTKHKGKPEHVPKEVIKKLRELIRMELESCGYTMSAEPPHKKLTSPGGLDDDLEEVSTTATAGGEYDTPNAFQSKGKEKRKRTAKMGTEFELVEGVKATKSFNNILKARNEFIERYSKLRKQLNTWLSDHTKQFGYNSDSYE